MSEVFGFMDLLIERQRQEAERERMKFWEAHLSAIFAQMPQEGEHPDFARARENFLRVIQPEPSNKPKKQFEWPAEIQEAIDSETPLLIVSDGEKGGN